MQPVEELLQQLSAATDALVDGIGGLTDADARGPSLLPGWTRGHVLTHLARNAEAIEDGAGRRAVVLLADVSAASAAFAEAAAVMPADAWQHMVTWTTGQQTPAGHVVESRLAEVLVHHVDLDVGFGPGRWPPVFVHEMLGVAVSALNERNLAPQPARLQAADTGYSYQLGGDAADAVQVSGTQADLLAWLLGRSDATRLTRDRPGPLPPVPSIYHT